MPTISPQVRASIGGGDTPLPRRSINISTGMNMPQRPKEGPQATQETDDEALKKKTGQSDIAEETPASPAVTLSPKATAIAREQQRLQSKEQALREKEAAFDAKVSDFVPKSSFKEKAKLNVAEALQELGTTYQELTDLQLAQMNSDDPVQKLTSEVENLKRAQEENVNKQYEATLKQYRAEADTLISSDPKTFHLINKGKHQDAVVQHIVDTWEESPDTVLTVAQAAKEVEEVLREEAKRYADALKELEPKEEKPTAKTLPPPQRSAPRTLTQQVETTPMRTYGQFQHLSMKERIAQAVARAQK